MAQVINTNSLSLITQNNINKNQSALSSSIERLSSGLRINSAKDDAAGQAIANRFTSNIKGLTQAARNANDGISVAQTTEGALSEINNNLQRIRELTVQATTGTNSTSDLDSIQDEIKSRLDEIDRVSGQTQFNGVNVLSKDGSMKIQVGANDGETITIDLKKIDSDTLNLAGFNVNGKGSVANTAATSDDLKLAGFTKGTTDTNGVTAYTNTISNDKAKASDLLANITDGSVITGGGANAFGVAAKNGYTYDAASKSYSFAADGADSAKALSIINPNTGDSSQATVTIGGKEQKVNISQDGKITAADDNATLYLDKQGNLTKTNAGNDTAATWDGLISNSDSTGAVPVGVATTITITSGTASGMSVQSAGAGIQTSTNSQILAGGAFEAKVSIEGGAATDILVASNGNITAANGSALYLDATTGRFTTTAEGNTAASLDNLIANSKDATLTVTSGTGQNTVYSTTGSGAQFTSLAKVDTVNVTNAHVSAEGMANLTKSNFTIDMGGTGTVTYTVSNGEVKAAANADVYVEDGALSANATKDVTYFEQKNGAIINSTGGTIYETADGKLTTEATTASSSTVDPLKALDEAISSIDKFRSSLGAVQNRLDSAVTNLNNTTTNLSEAQSRIQDADYATEVSNMSKAQIIQQAGNSVLAKANQVPQQVLSLLQG
ncbi:flagellin [Escherichia coli]|uniref:flagellin N-terminal helical domain-containing protein n=1 Tax=Escherichia coli TaxID=562 RepID=UPI000748FC75|nr:flagellin [Escherichia coli]EFE0687492.1 flagellin FliC [Escherichia coli]EKD2604382.1 flagellin FliC [Escherichia coli]KUH03734.1 flagellin [Escherichia coli]